MAPDVGPSWSFARRDDRVLAGVAGGFADRHGVDAVVVRTALVVLSLTGGLGVVLYAVGALVSTERDVSAAPVATHDVRRDASVACVTLGVALLARSVGLWLGDEIMVPILVVAAGVGLLAAIRPRTGTAATASAGDEALFGGHHARGRLVAGAVLVAIGVASVGARSSAPTGVRVGAFATALTLLGVALLLGPWLVRLAQGAAEDRRERIRAAEREAMAAHLHDSVLQTLALIQRTADDPRRVVTLARRQERELRDWLYGAPDARASGTRTLGTALRDEVGELEETYHLRVELVVVGDRELDEAGEALAAALREACVNAAKHSGTDEVSVYVEVGDRRVEAFVRDRGVGFDPDAVPSDRRGLAESVIQRVARHGGSAVIDSTPGAGTEVQLTIPIAVSDRSEPSGVTV